MGQRLTYLDGLRGIAAVLVVVHHFMVAFYPASYSGTLGDIHTYFQLEQWSHNTPLGILINGNLAVAIFLLLSGYMAAKQSEKKIDPTMFTSSVIKRYFRFFLLIISCNVIAFLLIWGKQNWSTQAAVITGSWWWLGDQWKMQPSFLTMLQQSFLSVFNVYSIKEAYNSSLWTMPLFFVGTIFSAAIMYFVKSLPKRMVLLGIIVGLTFKGYYYFLILGMMIYELQHWLQRDRLAWYITLLLVAGGIYFGGYPQAHTTASMSPWYHFLPFLAFPQVSSFYHGIGAICWLWLILYSGVLQRLLSRRLFVFLGERSFSLYVVHILVINSFSSWLFVSLIRHFSYNVAFGFSFAASWVIILLMTEGLFRFIEPQAAPISSRLMAWLSRAS